MNTHVNGSNPGVRATPLRFRRAVTRPHSAPERVGDRSLPLLALLVLSLIASPSSRGQDSTRVIPDGTEGEFLEMPDTSAAEGKGGKWNEFDTKITTLKFGFGFLYEVAAYSQDEESRQQFDLKTGYKVRDFRVLISGIIKSKRAISWKTGIMYDGPTDRWLVRESGVTIGVPELWGRFFVGRTKEGFSLNKVMNGYAGWMMERQMAVDIIPILADGVRWMAFLPAQGLFWDVGGLHGLAFTRTVFFHLRLAGRRQGRMVAGPHR